MSDRRPQVGPLVCALLAGAGAVFGVPSAQTFNRAFRNGSSLAQASPAFGLRSAWAQSAEKAGERMPSLEVLINTDDVDLESGRLLLRMSRPAARVTLKVIGLSGAVLADVSRDFDAAPAGSELVMQWSPPQANANGGSGAAAPDSIARIEVFGYDTSGYHKGVALTPWSFQIPDADVVFATDSAEIQPSEAGKLQRTLARINAELSRARHLGAITLFIVAHTDTVGTNEHNLKLSTRRAQAIARWFRANGLKMPIAYDGVGEGALQVQTADEVDEPRNRRVDYWLGLEPPRFKRSGRMPTYKRL